MIDGARVTTHSAIIGSTAEPPPEFGSFDVVGDHHVSLGTRRKPAIDQLQNQAIEFIDKHLVPLFSPAEDEKRLTFLWLCCGLMDGPATRKWCRATMSTASKLASNLLKRPELSSDDKKRIGTLAFYSILNEVIRSAHYGLLPLTFVPLSLSFWSFRALLSKLGWQDSRRLPFGHHSFTSSCPLLLSYLRRSRRLV